jgi:acyl-CoA thioester hydrolase
MTAITVLTHRVRYHEVDLQGVLFNARFLEIADVAQLEFFRMLGWDLAQLNKSGFDPVVVNVQANFTAPARFDEQLDIAVACTSVGNSSVTLDYIIMRGKSILANISIVHVNVDFGSGKSVPIPDEIAASLRSQITESTERK